MVILHDHLELVNLQALGMARETNGEAGNPIEDQFDFKKDKW
jgi:hypothetical protein